MRIFTILFFLFFASTASAQLIVPLKNMPQLPIAYEWNSKAGFPNRLALFDYGTKVIAAHMDPWRHAIYTVKGCGMIYCLFDTSTAHDRLVIMATELDNDKAIFVIGHDEIVAYAAKKDKIE
ncbi:MAG: hypothetical protein GY943_30625 [Chloroflexi bacterium]|nr:hypothetical protein [Chloroflexota bacterium]